MRDAYRKVKGCTVYGTKNNLLKYWARGYAIID